MKMNFYNGTNQYGRPINTKPILNQTKEVNDLMERIKTEPGVNFKTKKRLRNLIELNSNFFNDIDSEINKVLTNYDLESLFLSLKKCQILLNCCNGNLANITKSNASKFLKEAKFIIINCLKIEIEKEALANEIYNLLLKESKGKILDNFKGEKYKDELSFLYIFKKKKLEKEDQYTKLMKEGKHKSNIAKRLSIFVMSRMKTIISSGDKLNFIKIADKALEMLYWLKKYKHTAEITQLLLKVDKIFIEKDHQFRMNYITYGFLSNFQECCYEKSYIFFRIIGKCIMKTIEYNNKTNINGIPSKIEELDEKDASQNICLNKFETLFNDKLSGIGTEARMLLCFLPINNIFTKFRHHNTSQRLFFNKFQRQFGAKADMDSKKFV